MPRFTLLRLIKSFLLFWIALVGLWIFLPSLSPAPTNLRDHYIQNILTAGQTLHTVHKWHPSYASPGASGRVPHPSDDCSGLIIDWRLVSDVQHDSVSLDIGEHVHLNLTDAILKSTQKNDDDDADLFTRNNELYVSEVLNAHINAGDENHVINMPWFRWADMALFHHQMHGFTYAIQIRVVARDGKRVEIWKASTLDNGDDVNLIDPRPSDREFGVIASFSDLQVTQSARSGISGIVVSDVKGELPSKTYPTRSFLLVYLAPVLSVCLMLVLYVIMPSLTTVVLPLVAVYVVVVAICWCCSGRKDFVEWRANFWMTRCFFASSRRRKRSPGAVVIWGPSGPVYEERSETDSLIGSKRG
ncbi:hypothetical protein BGW36DRAFT_387200 [Talaromyces proteolyticus]|uniref:Uncharacterized protein n=1 Tax=Talaromyces proteolyticus TaxID=1131652 RepID=A0AAD4PX43_9EURO|nr:uncharacterized protein BGW36DRAFT_387200 [Talaromyces proteolyticus]KAH8692219.1 hypothetical protein BGW36DRAFT_387200 [Talaromyces proteolyticus]